LKSSEKSWPSAVGVRPTAHKARVSRVFMLEEKLLLIGSVSAWRKCAKASSRITSLTGFYGNTSPMNTDRTVG
jgi:hypothetical protein